MKPATAFPMEWDNDVGGVLIMLLEPALVDAAVDIDDDDEDVDGESGFCEEVAFPVNTRGSGLAVESRSECGADVDRAPENLAAAELRLLAVPLARVPAPVNLDRCICAM